jgi:hypothetical protein
MKRGVAMHRWLAVTAVLAMAGCSTVKGPYKPAVRGPIHDTAPTRGIEVAMVPRADAMVIGEPLVVDITVRNVGEQAVWLPHEPRLLLCWVYSNGRKDNHCLDPLRPRYYTSADATLMAPGDTMTQSIVLKTHYFPRGGLTEFRAVLDVAQSTNPNLHPFWSGRAVSNGYGILVNQVL